MAFVESKWIKFLRQYGPIPRNDNMYDESIQRALKKGHVQPITFPSEYLNELVCNFESDHPVSVILTGTAGDGKTYYCRQIWESLGGSAEAWEKGEKIQHLNLGVRTLTIIKDLSELTLTERSVLERMADAIMNTTFDEVFLVAANDGQLIEAWKSTAETINVNKVRKLIEELLVTDSKSLPESSLWVYNLSRLGASKMLPQILDAVQEHPGWSECNHCLYRESESLRKRCPIFENKQRLQEPTLRKRLIDLLELSELNDMHLPVRQLLILIANALLGHPDAKDRLMSCKEVPKILESEASHAASIYRNIFGENLPNHRRETTDVFSTLNRFGIGSETSNRIDNTLIFGMDDPELLQTFQALVLSDEYFGADAKFQAEQQAYLEGTSTNCGETFLELLSAQRQRLYFSIPDNMADELSLWNLSVFQFAGEYLESVVRKLRQKEKIERNILARLVRGINRIFTGLLTKSSEELILATSGSDSQSRVSHVLEGSISVPKKHGEGVTLEIDNDNKIALVVSFSRHQDVPPVKLRLNLVRFEFLCRVEEGTLPSSFSRECYEDMLAFKTRLIRQLELRQHFEPEEDDETENYMALKLISLDSESKIDTTRLEIRI
jgi:hypothetical protein